MNFQSIKKEINPVHDLEQFIELYNKTYNASSPSKEILTDNIALIGEYIKGALKSTVRLGTMGAIVGSSLGTISALVGGGDVSQESLIGMRDGALIGTVLDITQYNARIIFHLAYRKIASIF